MANLFKLEVHTPYRLFFSGRVEALIAVLSDGEIGVRANRAPFVAPLKTCALRVLTAEGVWREAAVTAGVIEVTVEGATVLAGSAEWPEEIDRERAQAAAIRAKELLAQDLMKYEAERARASQERSANRLAVLDRAVVHS
jgi:F-type H+-transporting ATPase subunit epsilon